MNSTYSVSSNEHRSSLLLGAILAFLLAFMVLSALLAGVVPGLSSLQLLALAMFLAVVTLTPAIISMRVHTQEFDLFHPLLYAAWFFFIPQFVISSFLIVLTNLQTSPSFLLFDPSAARITALEFALLGSVGLSVGYFLPVGRWLGGQIPQFKALDYSPAEFRLSIAPFLIIGIFAQILGFLIGVVGYSFAQEVVTLGATVLSFANIIIIAQGIIWYSFFKSESGWGRYALASIALALFNTSIYGSRGALLTSFLVILGGYQYAQSNLRPSKFIRWGVLFVLVVLLGVLFGSYFRQNKVATLGRTTQMSFDDVFSTSGLAITQIQALPLTGALDYTWQRLAERTDAITSLAVIAERADSYKDAEIARGIDQNILKDLATTFIPRVLWPDKPVVGVLEQIGNLYFGTQYTSPAVTYMGDLYRNFGILGIVVGMLILGIVLRSLYFWLIEKRTKSPLRVGLFMLLGWTTVNYESLISTYIPALVRNLFVATLVIMLVIMLRQRARQ